MIDGNPQHMRIAARIGDPSGRLLEVWTTQPGVQVYSSSSVRPRLRKTKAMCPTARSCFKRSIIQIRRIILTSPALCSPQGIRFTK
jgi:hypothetical protein